MSYTLQHSSTTQSLAAWGLTGVTLSEQSLEVGRLVARLDGDSLADCPFTYLDTVTLRQDSTVIFVGVTMPPKRVHDGGEGIMLEFVSPWWWLTQGHYSQDLYDAASEETKVAARAALFASITAGTSWASQTVAWTISQIVTACNSWHGSGKLQIGSFTGDFTLSPPPIEARALTFERALRECLQLLPDAVQQWDYSTSPPTVNFVRRGSATERVRSQLVSTGSEFVARNEDVLRGVRIVWLYKDLLGNPAATVDAAGETSGLGIAQTVINIDDQSEAAQTIPAITESQFVRSISTAEALDITGARPNDSEEWFFKYGGFSKIVATVADLVVLHPANAASVSGLSAGPYRGIAPTLEIDLSAEENAGATELSGNTRWMIEGDVPKWMTRTSHFRVGILKAEVLTRTLAPGSTRYEFQIHQVNMRLPLTDLGSSSGTTYTNTLQAAQVIGGGGGVIVAPTGLAAAVLAARSTLHYAGTWQRTAEECDLDLRCGDVLNLTDGRSEWETMDAHINSVTHELAAGRTTVVCGPPEHLGVQDLLRVFGQINPATWITAAAGGGEA